MLVPLLADVRTEVDNERREATVAGCTRLMGMLEARLTSEEQRRALADLRADPTDSDNQADLRKKLKKALAADRAFRQELQTILEQWPEGAETRSTTIATDGNIANRTSRANASIAMSDGLIDF
jgi:hypothetical protein